MPGLKWQAYPKDVPAQAVLVLARPGASRGRRGRGAAVGQQRRWRGRGRGREDESEQQQGTYQFQRHVWYHWQALLQSLLA